jgi:(p)ppGpp synthase/HD superfamily hydrolase
VDLSEEPAPSLEWLGYAKTHLARTRIREFLKKKDRELLTMAARELLQKALQDYGYPAWGEMSLADQTQILRHYQVTKIEELLQDLGAGNVELDDFIQTLALLSVVPRPHRSLNSATADRVTMRLEVEDRLGLLGDLGHVFARHEFSIVRMHSFPGSVPGSVIMEMEAHSTGVDSLEALYKDIYQIKNVRRLSPMKQV